MENSKPLKTRVTIKDIVNLIHMTIIQKHPDQENTIILNEIKSIDSKIKNGQLENYQVDHPFYWTCVFGEMKDNGYLLFDTNEPAKELNQEQPHINDYMKALSGEDLKRGYMAFKTWQATGKWEDLDSQLHLIATKYFEPLSDGGVSVIIDAYYTITAEIALRLFDEGK